VKREDGWCSPAMISHHAISTRTPSSRWALPQSLSLLDETTMMTYRSLHKWVVMLSYVMTYVRLNLWWVAWTQKNKIWVLPIYVAYAQVERMESLMCPAIEPWEEHLFCGPTFVSWSFLCKFWNLPEQGRCCRIFYLTTLPWSNFAGERPPPHPPSKE
jgi:hypothetical protein